MAEPGDSEVIYVAPAWRVKQSIEVLLSRDTHPFFIAYLWLRRQAGIQGTTADIVPNWAGLGELLRVPGGLPNKPYLRPFWRGQRNAHQEWLNANLAGSFAPSSYRSGYIQPVVTTNSSRRYVLQDLHWDKALTHFLYNVPLPALAVATYLLRDRGLVSTEPPHPIDLVNSFRQEFHYGDEAQEEFTTLFDESWGSADEDWFEVLQETAG